MNKKIIFQKCHLNNIYFFFNAIFIFIDLLIVNNICPNENELNELNEKKDNYYLSTKILTDFYIIYLSDFLAIIPYFIRKRLLKKKQGNIINIKFGDNRYIDIKPVFYNDKKVTSTKKKKKKIILFLFCAGILDFLEKFSLILYNIIYPHKELYIYSFSCIVPFEIIFQFICSCFILKIKFYKLQYFSLFLNLGIFIIILIIDIVIVSNSNSLDGKIFFFYAFNIIFYSIGFSLAKDIFLYGFISIYLFMIIKGFIGFILVLSFSLITLLVNKIIIKRIGFFFTKKKYIWLMIAKIISSFFTNSSAWLIIDRFSPNYLPLSLLFHEFCSFIMDIIYDSNYFKKNDWDLYIRIFLYLVSAIGVVIHNEIVVINICNLGSDTKYFLDIKVESDELFSSTDNPEIMKKYESIIELEIEKGDCYEVERDN